jgi:hypothetical protein
VDYGWANSNYEPEAHEIRQITIKKRDRLAILEWPYPEWARAWNQRSGETGLVALQFIKLYESATALYTWQPSDPVGYLAIQKNDELRVLEYPDDNWAKAWNQRTAETGLVPQNYISTISKQKA